MTIVDPSKELLRQYGLSEQYPGPVIVQQMDRSPYWASLGSLPAKVRVLDRGKPGSRVLFQPGTFAELYPKDRPGTRQGDLGLRSESRGVPEDLGRHASEVPRTRGENERQSEAAQQLLQAAEASMPKEDVGKHICRVVSHFPKGAGTMTTYIRLGKEDLEQLRELVNSPSAETPK